MTRDDLIITDHAAEQMTRRRISADEVLTALTTGEVIEDYPQAFPSAARLVLAEVNGRALHIVAADAGGRTVVVTVYEPDAARWLPGFRVRRT